MAADRQYEQRRIENEIRRFDNQLEHSLRTAQRASRQQQDARFYTSLPSPLPSRQKQAGTGWALLLVFLLYLLAGVLIVVGAVVVDYL